MQITDVIDAIKILENFNSYTLEELVKLLEDQEYEKVSKEQFKKLRAYKNQGATNADLINQNLINLK